MRTGDELEIVGIKEATKTTCTGVEMFRKTLDEGRAGENCGVQEVPTEKMWKEVSAW